MFLFLFCDKSVAVVTLNAKDHNTVRRDNPNTIKLVAFPASTHFYGIMGICHFAATQHAHLRIASSVNQNCIYTAENVTLVLR